MGIGTPRVARLAGNVRLCQDRRGRSSDDTVPVPSGRQADQDGQGDGAGHGRLPATESHRRGVLQM